VRKKRLTGCLLALGLLLATGAATALAGPPEQAPISAPQVSKFDTGDTAWMLVSTALVLMMTVPGLALFYGGLVRTKNILSTLMHSFFCAALIGVTWVLFGYTLAYGPDKGGLIGGLAFLGLHGVQGTASALAPTIPQILFVVYQATFAIITPALISGTFAERMRFPAFTLFMLLWSTLIYAPLAHWVWGGGWIATKVGALDFAGGTVVHIASGISALVAALYVGKRLGHGTEPMTPHNLPLTVLGASLLWVGWFGFNAGSAMGANELASIAFVNTNTAAAAAVLGWLTVEWLRNGKPTMLGAASGAVAGLVAITPAAGFVTPLASVLIGLAGGAVCYLAVSLKPRFGYDDALDVVGVHMVGGTLGALLTGVFATAAINSAVPSLSLGLTGGLLAGQPRMILQQLIAVLATYAYCGIGTLALLVVIDAIMPLRADHDEQIVGMDLSQHSERAYAMSGGESVAFVRLTEPRPASVPPAGSGRFSVVIDGIDEESLLEHWRGLCKANGDPPTDAFKEIYRHVTTVRGVYFRFRGGNRERIRQMLEGLFREAFPNVRARIACEEHAPALV
jgi:Amt family ammonium transporter